MKLEIKKYFWLSLILSLIISSAYAKYKDVSREFHCRITDAVDYETREKITKGFFVLDEDIVETSIESSLAYKGWGNFFSTDNQGHLEDSKTGKRRLPYMSISKLDGKFWGTFLYSEQLKDLYPEGVIVSGFCKEINQKVSP